MNAYADKVKARARARAAARRNQEGVAPSHGASVGLALDRVFNSPRSVGPGYGADTRGSVSPSPEFYRVVDLPRGDWRTRTDMEDIITTLTETLRTPEGEMVLRPIQAALLEALLMHRGCLGAVGVGEGKTLTTYLAGEVLGAARPLLIVPAKLKAKTARDFSQLSKHWSVSVPPEVVSFEWLGRVQGAEFLEEYQPDLLIADEAQRLRNPRAAVTRRVVRYLLEHPETAAMFLSGTIASRSLMDFHHLLRLSVGPERMPLPAPRTETKEWARAVDEKATTRARPGVLTQLLPRGEEVSLANVRTAVGRRIFETPGVLSTDVASVGASMLVEFDETPPPKDCVPLIKDMVASKLGPDGRECLPTDVARHVSTLLWGFFYKWDPTPPEDWMDARRDWTRFVRDILDQEDPLLDSELQVANACRRGALDSWGVWEAWSSIRDEFTPTSVPVWVAPPPLPKFKTPTLLWVSHTALGERLAEDMGLDYYHRRGLNSRGEMVEDADPDKSLILSVGSNSEGRNLQAWAANYVATPPASGAAWEQLMGRTHRAGQEADEVNFLVRLGHPQPRGHLIQAVADAEFISATTGQPQRLLAADFAADLA